MVCCTLTGVQVKDLRDERFDVAIVDEAAQALEVATWGALLKASRAILAGDHLQLPPTVISKSAEKGGLGCTLFERLQVRLVPECNTARLLPAKCVARWRRHTGVRMAVHSPLFPCQEMYGEGISEMLTVQYRMNKGVMRWSSDELYQGRLSAAEAVADHTLGDIQVMRSA